MITRQDNLYFWFEAGIDVAARRIFIGSNLSHRTTEEVDGEMAEYAIKALLFLDSVSNDPIVIILNSEGGQEYPGMAIYDTIKGMRSHVTIEVRGSAMSMGSIILQAADHRIITKHSRIMIHYGTFIQMGEIPVRDGDQWVKEDKRFRREMEDIYLRRIKEKHPKFSRKKLQTLLEVDTILSAEEAVQLGLVDEIICAY